MSRKGPPDLSQLSMLELFQIEVETQSAELTTGLLRLEQNSGSTSDLSSLMRAAHSLKGAARLVSLNTCVPVAHAMEDCLTGVQNGERTPTPELVDTLLGAVDLLRKLAQMSDGSLKAETDAFLLRIATQGTLTMALPAPAEIPQQVQDNPPDSLPINEKTDVRVSSENLSRLLFMAGESLVASRRLHDCWQSLRRLKLADATAQLDQLEAVDRTFFNLSHRLHEEVLECRMRPLSEAITGLPRMVRDVARELGKSAQFQVAGGSTAVDRDILERLKVPLMHLLRNAIDHGIEEPQVRRARGKPDTGTIQLDARHSGGMLLVAISDDGNGIDRTALQAGIARKGLSAMEVLAEMSDAEIFQFLFLPGFSMKDKVTDISGRGVGLDVVHTTVKEVGGSVRVSSAAGTGTRFELELPLTLSIIRALVVSIGGEAYAFPLSRITAVVKVPRSGIETIEGRQHCRFRNVYAAVIPARELLEVDGPDETNADVSLVMLGDVSSHVYGLEVDRFLEERELVVLGLDPALGKIPGVSAGAVMPDDSPLLILDVDDLIRSFENLLSQDRVKAVAKTASISPEERRKRVLAVDDSLTVRELERKLLQSRGYEVETAVDGMAAWNSVRAGHFDLVVTDIDMPRMDGIELLKLIKNDARLQSTPVMIVSYKDREEDRRRGLESGADYYLTKGSFQDDTLLQAVADLIGEAGHDKR
jgi:two-component system, chemotaxis family, sensor histidine kinase and response regulator WspE